MTEIVHGIANIIVVDDPAEIAKAQFDNGKPLVKPYLRITVGDQAIAISTNIAEMIGGAGSGVRQRWEDQQRESADSRIVYGANCVWWDSISKAGDRGGMPCCPHCHGMLFEFPNEQQWLAALNEYAIDSGDQSYPAFMQWLRGKCFKRIDIARAAYVKSVQ